MRDIVVIGASAGGIEAVRQIASQLRQDIPAAVFVVVHLSPDSSGLLPTILNRRSRVPAHQPEDKETIEPGQIYVAAPDRHMMLEAGRVRMSRGPKHNRHRPAIDLLFRTAARNFGERVIGVVLTGFLDDGSSGLLAIKNAGGVAIIQSPEDAEVAFMPRNALQQVEPDYCVPLREIGQLINALTDVEDKVMAAAQADNGDGRGKSGKKRSQTSFTCPDCHGSIWQVNENGEIRYECRVGHAYSPSGMAAANDEDLERSLWYALRALEESAVLQEHLAQTAAGSNRQKAEKLFVQKAQERKQHAAVLRELLVGSRRRETEAEGDLSKQPMERVV